MVDSVSWYLEITKNQFPQHKNLPKLCSIHEL